MKVKVILVDDAIFIREIIRKALEAEKDMEIVGEAENGAEAVDLAFKAKPDIIIMDIVMPVQSGIDATKKIREKNKEVKIIACSTMSQEMIRDQAMKAGFSDYIIKPFKPEELVSLIRKHIPERKK